MKRLALALTILAALVGSAAAQGGMMPGPGMVGSAPAPTFTNFDSKANTSCGFGTTCAVASLVVPTGFAVFAVTMDNQGGTPATATSLALSGGCSGSLTAAVVNSIPAGGRAGGVFYGTVTGGTCTATVTSSFAGSLTVTEVSVGLLSNLSSTTPGSTCNATQTGAGTSPYACSGSITVPAGGFGICSVGADKTTAITSSTLTINSQSNNTNFSGGIGSRTSTGTPDFITDNFATTGIACAPWR